MTHRPQIPDGRLSCALLADRKSIWRLLRTFTLRTSRRWRHLHNIALLGGSEAGATQVTIPLGGFDEGSAVRIMHNTDSTGTALQDTHRYYGGNLICSARFWFRRPSAAPMQGYSDLTNNVARTSLFIHTGI